MLAVGAAVGATALLAGPAQAATETGPNYVVNSNADTAPDGCDDTSPDGCTLREAVLAANADGVDSTITFDSNATDITLNLGEIVFTNDGTLTIDGQGAVTITQPTGDTDATAGRIFHDENNSDTTLTGLKLVGGNPPSGPGGSVFDDNGGLLTIANSTISGATATNNDGGGVAALDSQVTITGSTIKGNQANNGYGGGVYGNDYSDVTIADSTIGGSGDDKNQARSGGGVAGTSKLSITGSTISGNTATFNGGGVGWFGYSDYQNRNLHIADSVISNNAAYDGGGLAVGQEREYQQTVHDDITRTTISGNTAQRDGAGIQIKYLGRGDHFVISQSTISGNVGSDPESHRAAGGGLMLGGSGSRKYINGEVGVSDSTISGNTSDVGGGVSVGGPNSNPTIGPYGSEDFGNSTIASNTATQTGGGIYLGAYGGRDAPIGGGVVANPSPTVDLTSTVVGNNQLQDGTQQDLDRADDSTSGGFDLSFSLVENPGDAPLTGTPANSNITGVDPQLGPLGDNGGPTLTQMPTNVSPLVDRGKAPARLLEDQRGHNRTVEGDAANTPGGDGTDIGAVEVDSPAKNAPVGPTTTPLTPGSTTTVVHRPKNKVPVAVIKKNRLFDASKLFVRGIAFAFDGHKVKSVDVAIVNKKHGRCRVLKANGDFSAFHRCGRTKTFLKAQGKSKWKFTLDKPLPPGYYVVYSRAHDNAGRRQFLFGQKSRRQFNVR